MGFMLNNLVIMLCSTFSLHIYQTLQVHIVCLCIKQPLYMTKFWMLQQRTR